jgi:RNA polymerase sigma-70 factor, ECF subfamily
MHDDYSLVRRFQAGDDEAFDVLLERHRRRIYNLVCRLVGVGEADDLSQEVFLAAYRSLPSFRGDASFSTWLYRVAVHTCAHHLRRRRPETAELDEELADLRREQDPEQSALRRELQDRVRGAIDALPFKLRLVIVLRDMHGLSYDEIASVAGCPIGTVRSRLHYATQRLAAALDAYVNVG